MPLIRAAVERKTADLRNLPRLSGAERRARRQPCIRPFTAVGDYDDHREPQVKDFDIMFAARHPVKLKGELKKWVGQDEIIVNSLHGRASRRLAKPLTAEAFAEDGLIEAVRAPARQAFSLGVQWHPEWQLQSNPASLALFRRFGDAARGMIAKGQAA